MFSSSIFSRVYDASDINDFNEPGELTPLLRQTQKKSPEAKKTNSFMEHAAHNHYKAIIDDIAQLSPNERIKKIIDFQSSTYFNALKIAYKNNPGSLSPHEMICYAFMTDDLKEISFEHLQTAFRQTAGTLDAGLTENLAIMLQAISYTRVDQQIEKLKSALKKYHEQIKQYQTYALSNNVNTTDTPHSIQHKIKALELNIATIKKELPKLENICQKDFSRLIEKLQSRHNDQYINLSGLHFKNADLKNVRLMGVNLEGAVFNRSNLKRANLLASNVSRSSFVSTSLSHANLKQTRFDYAIMKSGYLTSADASGSSFAWARLEDTLLDSTNMHRCNLNGTQLIKVHSHWSTNFSKAFFKHNSWLDNDDLKTEEGLLAKLSTIKEFIERNESLKSSQKISILESVVAEIHSAVTPENAKDLVSEKILDAPLFKLAAKLESALYKLPILAPLKRANEFHLKQRLVL